MALGGGDKDWGECLPVLEEFGLIFIDITPGGVDAYLVGFSKYDGEGHLIFAEPFEKIQINLLRLMPDVDEHEEAYHLPARENIRVDDM